MSVSLLFIRVISILILVQVHDEDDVPILEISRRESGALDCLFLGRTSGGEEGMDTR